MQSVQVVDTAERGVTYAHEEHWRPAVPSGQPGNAACPEQSAILGQVSNPFSLAQSLDATMRWARRGPRRETV